MDVFVARQPIFDTRLKVFAYELLFRVGRKNVFVETDGDKATSSVIADSFLVIGMESLTRGRKAFINFTENLLLDETATILPKDILVVEILENVVPSQEIIKACKKLKDSGYKLALDDFVFEPKFTPLLELADIVKVDFKLSGEEERQSLIDKLSSTKIKFLAEKVETQEEYEQAKEMGFSYFQGYFFSKPVVISRKDIQGNKLNYLNVLHEINLPEVNFTKIEDVIKRDVSLSYKLLKFINSAFFSFNKNVKSIKQALVLLGINEFRKWMSLIILKGMIDDKPEELLIISISRARFCEMIAVETKLKDRSLELFFMGMFSMIDTFIGRPMGEVLENLPLSEETKDALIGEDGSFKEIYDLALAYEKGEWDKISKHAEELGISLTEIHDFYIESLEWANQLIST